MLFLSFFVIFVICHFIRIIVTNGDEIDNTNVESSDTVKEITENTYGDKKDSTNVESSDTAEETTENTKGDETDKNDNTNKAESSDQSSEEPGKEYPSESFERPMSKEEAYKKLALQLCFRQVKELTFESKLNILKPFCPIINFNISVGKNNTTFKISDIKFKEIIYYNYLKDYIYLIWLIT